MISSMILGRKLMRRFIEEADRGRLALFGDVSTSGLGLLSGGKRKLHLGMPKGRFWRIVLKKSATQTIGVLQGIRRA